MELRKSIDFRKIVAFLFVVFFLVYLIIGLQPAAGATKYEISNELIVPTINLDIGVTSLKLKNRKLETPDTIVGSFAQYKNKTLLIGHVSTVFYNLDKVSLGDEINYDSTIYHVSNIVVLKKEAVDMDEIMAPSEKQTIVIMTCAGESIGESDSTHRLIVTAQAL